MPNAYGMRQVIEERSLVGWRHVVLVVLAQAFRTPLHLDPKADAPA
jgi:hypothetical protein